MDEQNTQNDQKPGFSNNDNVMPVKAKRKRWKLLTAAFIYVVAVGLVIFSAIMFEAEFKSRSVLNLIPWDNPPAYTGKDPQNISEAYEAYSSMNNLVLIFTPCSNTETNDSTLKNIIQAANRIRSQERIYVGVFILPQDDTLAYPELVLRLYTVEAQGKPVTLREDITANKVYSEYADRKFLRP